MARRLIAQDRYAFILLREAEGQISEGDAREAWPVLDAQMALIPGGNVPVVLCDGTLASVEIEPFYLDRYAVTNRQYQRFVQARGYDDLEIWPSEVWPSVARFTDRTGRPGPRDWENGKFPAARAEHPVVGVCWYECVAYALGRQAPAHGRPVAEGRRLARAAQRRDVQPLSLGQHVRARAHEPVGLRVGQTVPVREYPSGATANGIYQMTGNVWEWLDDPLETIPCLPGEYFQAWKPLRRIIGGAYNTYFPSEATCQFVTGQGELDRARISVSVAHCRSPRYAPCREPSRWASAARYRVLRVPLRPSRNE